MEFCELSVIHMIKTRKRCRFPDFMAQFRAANEPGQRLCDIVTAPKIILQNSTDVYVSL